MPLGPQPREAHSTSKLNLGGNGFMARCEVCGNDYDKSFTIELQGQSHVFDSFECAIQALAPECGHCHCRIIGHGVENGEQIYCCANCARQAGVPELADRAA
jgi:hypothetical protein